MEKERHSGVVVDWRGTYGFLRPASGGGNVFVHQSDLAMDGYRELVKTDIVEFSYEACSKGVKAIAVVVVKPADEAA
ncbi:MAG: cold shock domain-containing protein [Bryobacteraceae bacterium]|jgi:cold shock CspA family protein